MSKFDQLSIPLSHREPEVDVSIEKNKKVRKIHFRGPLIEVEYRSDLSGHPDPEALSNQLAALPIEGSLTVDYNHPALSDSEDNSEYIYQLTFTRKGADDYLIDGTVTIMFSWDPIHYPNEKFPEERLTNFRSYEEAVTFLHEQNIFPNQPLEQLRIERAGITQWRQTVTPGVFADVTFTHHADHFCTVKYTLTNMPSVRGEQHLHNSLSVDDWAEFNDEVVEPTERVKGDMLKENSSIIPEECCRYGFTQEDWAKLIAEAEDDRVRNNNHPSVASTDYTMQHHRYRLSVMWGATLHGNTKNFIIDPQWLIYYVDEYKRLYGKYVDVSKKGVEHVHLTAEKRPVFDTSKQELLQNTSLIDLFIEQELAQDYQGRGDKLVAAKRARDFARKITELADKKSKTAACNAVLEYCYSATRYRLDERAFLDMFDETKLYGNCEARAKVILSMLEAVGLDSDTDVTVQLYRDHLRVFVRIDDAMWIAEGDKLQRVTAKDEQEFSQTVQYSAKDVKRIVLGMPPESTADVAEATMPTYHEAGFFQAVKEKISQLDDRVHRQVTKADNSVSIAFPLVDKFVKKSALFGTLPSLIQSYIPFTPKKIRRATQAVLVALLLHGGIKTIDPEHQITDTIEEAIKNQYSDVYDFALTLVQEAQELFAIFQPAAKQVIETHQVDQNRSMPMEFISPVELEALQEIDRTTIGLKNLDSIQAKKITLYHKGKNFQAYEYKLPSNFKNMTFELMRYLISSDHVPEGIDTVVLRMPKNYDVKKIQQLYNDAKNILGSGACEVIWP